MVQLHQIFGLSSSGSILSGSPVASESDEQEGQQDQNQIDNQQTDSESMDGLTLEMELDPFKSMMQKIRTLLRSGQDEDLIKAYQITASALDENRFYFDPKLHKSLYQTFESIKEQVKQNPALCSILSESAYTLDVDEFAPAAPRPAIKPSVSFVPVAFVPKAA